MGRLYYHSPLHTLSDAIGPLSCKRNSSSGSMLKQLTEAQRVTGCTSVTSETCCVKMISIVWSLTLSEETAHSTVFLHLSPQSSYLKTAQSSLSRDEDIQCSELFLLRVIKLFGTKLSTNCVEMFSFLPVILAVIGSYSAYPILSTQK